MDIGSHPKLEALEVFSPQMFRTTGEATPEPHPGSSFVVSTYARHRVDVDRAAIHRHTQLFVFKMHAVSAEHVPERRRGWRCGERRNRRREEIVQENISIILSVHHLTMAKQIWVKRPVHPNLSLSAFRLVRPVLPRLTVA